MSAENPSGPNPEDFEKFLRDFLAGNENADAAKLAAAAGLPNDPAAIAAFDAVVRDHVLGAGERGLDTGKIGVIGFSAGARTTIRLIEQKDEAKLAENVALLYPPMTQVVKGGPRPPLFLAIAGDDPLFLQGRLGLAANWLGESPKVEFHLYSGGSHGFGMGVKGTTSDLWIDQYIAWLDRH